MKQFTARNIEKDPRVQAETLFSSVINDSKISDALFTDTHFSTVVAVAGLPYHMPCVTNLYKNHELGTLLNSLTGSGNSLLFLYRENTFFLYKAKDRGAVSQVALGDSLNEAVLRCLHYIRTGAGYLNEEGEHCIDLAAPDPGPHFSVNLLLGNRLDYAHPIHTTPKSVVNRLGGGSFRSHAFTQVLALRWDMRQEENGFPANRQFYLTEDGGLVLYSAQPTAPSISSAWCRHGQNYTQIVYNTTTDLKVTRTITLLPQAPGAPIATEAQRIAVTNNGSETRNLRLVYTGMFASMAPHALWEDVLYSNIIMQGGVLKNQDGSVLAVTPSYFPQRLREDLLFHSSFTYDENGVRFPVEFCTDYNDFVGNGSLYLPDSLSRLSNRLSRKGPGFFALAIEITVGAGSTIYVDNLTGLVSSIENPDFKVGSLQQEIGTLLQEFRTSSRFDEYFENNQNFFHTYSDYMQVTAEDKAYESYINRNLPFQVLYQTFVSRSFSLTQKGYRELGFREIQDIFASMYFFFAMGKPDFIRQVILAWGENVYEYGYTNHNFFWRGKEPGRWSDDGLWLVQAVYRYINLSGDIEFIHTPCKVAGTDSLRPLYQTLKQIIGYSAEISVGKHGLPLLDFADWNDCLKIDLDFIPGPEKIKIFKQNPQTLRRSLSEYTESVMNAFLLKLAVDQMRIMSAQAGKEEDSIFFGKRSAELYSRIREHAWKKDFFARLLFNRRKSHNFSFLGAGGDGLSLNPQEHGSYYLNSFSWAVLSGCADDRQIAIMLDTIDTHLKTPFGYKLCTEVDLNKVSPNTAAGYYFAGDRENAGIFKHASMMAVSAMFKAAKEVHDPELARRLARSAYWMMERVLPFHTMTDPYKQKGNPRFCTQYINSQTGEHIGPMLSGTATWLALSIFDSLGIDYVRQELVCNPILREEEEHVDYMLKTPSAGFHITVKKPRGFFRIQDHKPVITFDGNIVESNVFPLLNDGKNHSITLEFGL